MHPEGQLKVLNLAKIDRQDRLSPSPDLGAGLRLQRGGRAPDEGTRLPIQGHLNPSPHPHTHGPGKAVWASGSGLLFLLQGQMAREGHRAVGPS